MKGVRWNSLFGFLGFAIPTIVIFIAYPTLVHHLGEERFGIFVLATSFSGVLAFLDLGLFSATTKFVAEDIRNGDPNSAGEVVATSMLFFSLLGGIVAIIVWLASPWVVSLFAIRPDLHNEAIWAFRLAAVQFFATMLTTVFLSLFRGVHRFDMATLVLTILSVTTYGGVAIGVSIGGFGLIGATATSMTANLFTLVVAVMIGRAACRAKHITLNYMSSPFSMFRRLFGFGSVMMVNSIADLLLNQVQRYLIGGMIGPAEVGVYQLATTIPSKAHSMVNSVTQVLFPLASGERDRAVLRPIYFRMLAGSGLIALLVLVPLALFAEPLMTLWVGNALASKAAPLVPVFAAAFFVLALSPAPYHIVNGVGKPWLNTASYSFNAVINISLIGIFSLNGITLVEFAWAFAIANIMNGMLYQVAVEIFIWRNDSIWVSSRAPIGGV